jgi:hypothetical protein
MWGIAKKNYIPLFFGVHLYKHRHIRRDIHHTAFFYLQILGVNKVAVGDALREFVAKHIE